MEQKKIMELLEDKDTYTKLKTIGFTRNKIWYLHRQILHLESNISMIENEITKKHSLTMIEMMNLSICADCVFEGKLKKKGIK